MPWRKILIIGSLMLAGELVFLLPFVFPRIFRPTLLDVFDLSNVELGTAYSVYGLTAILSYLFGGPLADRYAARNLMSLALMLTALCGVGLTFTPGFGLFVFLYALWGATTILLFWAAMLKATRIWGGDQMQGAAFGMLDGGRGLVAALVASSAVFLLALLLPENAAEATMSEKQEALQQIIWLFTTLTALTAIIVWIIVPKNFSRQTQSPDTSSRITLNEVLKVARMPVVWLQAIVVLCAYVGYKSTDDFSLYARDAFGYDDVHAAQMGTMSFWTRPAAAVLAGFLADRLNASKVIIGGFAVMAAGCFAIASGLMQADRIWLLIWTIIGTSVGIYALRGAYFALLGETKVPLGVTGTTIGIISVVGFLPDVFMGPWMGYLIDSAPGAEGHQNVFRMVGSFALAGLAATLALRSMDK